MALRLTPGSGVVEHTVEWEWRGSFAFANIGLAGNAFTGKDWYKKHNPALKELFTYGPSQPGDPRTAPERVRQHE